MKAFTIEEIKQLKTGDWIWLVDMDKQSGQYAQVDIVADFCVNKSKYRTFYFMTSNRIESLAEYTYGTDWLAYRNKEEAECEGVLVELPCKVGDTACRFGRKSSGEIFIVEGKCIKVEMNKKGILIYFNTLTNWYYDEMDIGYLTDCYIDLSAIYFCTKEQAEQKLKELQNNED